MVMIDMTREEQISKAVEEIFNNADIALEDRAMLRMWYNMGAKFADDNPKDTVDWQQVRIQAAIAAMQGFLASKTMMEIVDETVKIGQLQGIEVSADSAISRMSIGFADALVKELKGE
jgi:hypothetical protein